MLKNYLIVAIMGSLLFGCANKNIPQIEANYYKQCIQPFVKMQEMDNKIVKNTAGTALAGALAGAVIGLASTGKVGGALVGAGVGAISGAAIGYSYTKINQITDENTRFASIRITANRDLSKANRLQLYSYECMMCYVREFDSLQSDYENGKILKTEYADRFKEIRNAMVKLGGVIGGMEEEIKRTDSEFNASLATSSKQIKQSTTMRKQPRAKSQKVEKSKEKRSPSRVGGYTVIMTQKLRKIEQAEEKNDEDLNNMLNDFAGKSSPPKQDIVKISLRYKDNYDSTKEQIEDLRKTHREVMEIMDKTAIEAGIDMV